ncbi:fumarylacetoacetate hydrolase family protein [Streptomyces sp. NPDC050528]|uniref:fumarylacetoacetate hydrolase family protein n=1 Tax=unclassified Streptomyces TaxID=2593676 RepID=UPI0037905587
MTTTPQTGTGASGSQAVALQFSEQVLKTVRYDDMAAFCTHALGHGPFCAGDVQKGRFPGRAANVTAAKSFDTFTPRGSPLVTLDEFTHPNHPRQDARTSQLIHPVPALVSYLSRQTTLEPGDVISTGTPAGVGHRRGLLLRSCTEVCTEIEEVGAVVRICA